MLTTGAARNGIDESGTDRAVAVGTAVGAVGSVLIAAGSWSAGALPASYRTDPPAPIDAIGVDAPVARIAFYLGLALLVGAWLALGRLLATGRIGPRQLVLLVACWSAPFLLALPIGSRDLWAYAAQGDLIHHGLNPYDAVPADRPGSFLDNVSAKWTDSTSPYGPLWTLFAHVIALACGDHVVVTVLVTRLPVALGLALALPAILQLAERAGARGDVAVWAAIANPLTLVLALGGGHNDLLLMGLMTAGAAVALRPGRHLTGLVIAAALMTAAAAVKSPAAIGIAFVVPLWFARPDPRSANVGAVLRAVLLVVATTVATFAVITLATGDGLGWLDQVNSRAPVVNWLSLPTAVAMLVALVRHGRDGATHLDATMEHLRTAGLVIAGTIGVTLWLGSLYPRLREPVVVVAAFAAALTAVIVLGPAVQPWYFVWVLPMMAVTALPRRAPVAFVAASLGLLLLIRPRGSVLIMSPAAPAVLAGCVLLAWLAAGRPRRRSVPGDDDADGSRARVRTDGRADL